MIIRVNGSPRGGKSTSAYLLEALGISQQETSSVLGLAAFRRQICEEDLTLQEGDSIVFAFPLYFDSLPGSMMAFLEQTEGAFAAMPRGIRVYGIVNLGFYEGKQGAIALNILRCWCERAGLEYGGGLMVGAGEMMGRLRNIPLTQGPNRNLGKGLQELQRAILENASMEDKSIEPAGFPRRLYIAAGHSTWKKMAKENGVKI